ncbi:MAG: spore cortex biosynthesis protein YabQ [Eubacteriales bacterium]
MSELITTQGHLFVISILSGFAIGVFYDIIRIIRRVIKHSNWLINVEDVLFWVISSVFLFVILFNQNGGVIRGYAIIGVGLGMFLYFGFLSQLFVKTISNSINYILKMIGKVIKIILKPIRFLVHFLLKPFKWIRKVLKVQKRNSGKQLKKWIKTVKIVIKKI